MLFKYLIPGHFTQVLYTTATSTNQKLLANIFKVSFKSEAKETIYSEVFIFSLLVRVNAVREHLKSLSNKMN